jgi:hypothetical protein
MKKFSLFLMLSFPLILSAQTWPVDTIKRTSEARPWLLSVSVRQIFMDSQTPWGFGLKRESNKGGGAFRIYNALSFSDNVNNEMEKYNLKEIIMLGYESRKDFEKWTVFYGVDVRAEYERNVDKDDNIPYYKKTHNYEIGLHPFIGASYRINKYLSVSTEFGEKMMLGKINNGYMITASNQRTELKPSSMFSFGEISERLLCINYHF